MNCIQMISEQIPIFIHDQRNYLQQINACIEEFKDWLKADNIYIKTLENCLNQMNLQINSFLIYL